MATRSTISLQLENGQVKTIYCHNDGYLSGVGATLLKSYSTTDRVEALIKLGDLSSLYDNLEPTKGSGHSFDKRERNVTVAYGRDRGETNVDYNVYGDFNHAQKEQYNYLFKDGKWYVAENESKRLKLLA